MIKTKGKKLKKKNIPLKHVILISSAKSALITGIILIIFSVLLTFLSLPHTLIDSMALFALCCGISCASFFISKAVRKNGIIIGLICAVSVYCLLILLSLIFGTFGAYPAHITKFIIMVLCGMIFGIIGVNRPLKNDFK